MVRAPAGGAGGATVPELPEVETVRRMLLPLLVGTTVSRVEVFRAHVTGGEPPAAFAARVRGRMIAGIARRGKYLIFDLERAGAPPLQLVVHLRMTGRLVHVPPRGRWILPAAHTHAIFHLRGPAGPGGRLGFYDVRKFGRFALLPPAEVVARLPRGRDPVLDGLDAAQLRALCAGRMAPLKTLLLRQELVAGLGNIYADEALHRAGIHPARPATSLAPQEWEALAVGIRTVLAEALTFSGTTLMDYRRPDGAPGAFGQFLRVYGRGGAPCRTCGTAVATLRLSGRSAAFCPRCQPAAPSAGPL
jgi:formamidopyrimidine-DNA glycosylase